MLIAVGVHAAPTADTLFLKDKTMRVGRIMSQDSATTSIQTDNDLLVISADEIARVGREQRRDLLLPLFSVYVNAGISVPSDFGFPQGFGLRPGVRYMISRGFGIGASFSYASWQINYDTVKGFKNTTFSTETFVVTAAAPRVGAFVVTSLAPNTRLIFGIDVGQSFVSASSSDTSADTQTGFSYAIRGDMRFGLTERFALLLGLQYESLSTSFTALEQHNLAIGARHRIGDMLYAAGAEISF